MPKLFFLFLILCLNSVAVAQSIDWLPLEEAQSKAIEHDKKVLIFAEADWCGYCRKMNKEVFPEQTVVDSMAKYFYPVRLDIESRKEVKFNGKPTTEQILAGKFRALQQTPTTIFLDAAGSVIGIQPGFLPQDIFDKLLAYVGSDFYNQFSFEKYLDAHDIDTE